MQQVELGVIAITVLGGLGLLAIRTEAHSAEGSQSLRLLMGVVLGAVAAFVVLVPQTDLIPDEIEAVLGPIIVASITVALLAGTWWRLRER